MTENNTHPRVLVSGDIHGSHSIRKLSSRNFNKNNELNLTKQDYLIITGDFGLIWSPKGSRYYNDEQYWLKWLDEKPWTTLFVDGNHESFPLLNSYPVEEWHGGKIHRVSNSILHLMRGQVFNINNQTFFTLGGGYSHDIEYRTEGLNWWREEVPSFCEREEALANLAAHDWKVDYVITHDAPVSIAYTLINRSYDSSRTPDEYEQWLEDEILSKLEFKQWFFGHHHQDCTLKNGKGQVFQAMYNDIVSL